jgi:hypothetical protein
MSAVSGRCASSVIGTAGGRATVSVRRKSAARISVLASVSRGPLRCRATGDRNSEERTSKETIGRLERLLGIEPEQEEPEIPRQDVPKERKQVLQYDCPAPAWTCAAVNSANITTTSLNCSCKSR